MYRQVYRPTLGAQTLTAFPLVGPIGAQTSAEPATEESGGSVPLAAKTA